MALFSINTSAEAVRESSGSKYIGESGIYDVTIKFASLDVSKGGAESVNFNVEYEGSSQTIYGPYVTSKDGKPLEIGLKLINNLGVIAGMTNGQEPVIEEEEHKVGRDNKLQTFAVITDFSDLPVKMRVQEEYSKYNGEIKKRLAIKAFYREDGATASEIVNESEAGVQLERDKAYASNVTYRDDLTEDEVKAWKEAKASGNATPAPTPKKAAASTGSLFK